ncbi:hypothetical protein HDU81_008101 [Chytriomyces hyalinus]|nr:hypothetical protein HDU81_008101 [Chytriomyces hyalinus]
MDSYNQSQCPDKSTGPPAPELGGDSYRLTPAPPLTFPTASLVPPCRSDRSILKLTCYGRCNFQSDGCGCPNSRGTAPQPDVLTGGRRIQADASSNLTQEQRPDLQQKQQQHDRTPPRTTSSTLSQPQSCIHGNGAYSNLRWTESPLRQDAFAGLPGVSTGALLPSNTLQKTNKCSQQANTKVEESPGPKTVDDMQWDVGGANANLQLENHMEMTSMSPESFEKAIELAYNSRPSAELVKKRTNVVELTRRSFEDVRVSPAKRRRNEEQSPSMSPSLSSDSKELDELMPLTRDAQAALASDWKNEEVKFIAAVDTPYGPQTRLDEGCDASHEKMASNLPRLKSAGKTIDNLSHMAMYHDLFAPQGNLIAMTAEIPSSTAEMESIIINASNTPLDDKASLASDNDEVWHTSVQSPQGFDFPNDNNSLPNSLDPKKQRIRDERDGNEVSPSNRNTSPFAAVARSPESQSPFTAKRVNFDSAYNLMEDSLSEVDTANNNDRGRSFLSHDSGGSSSEYATKSPENSNNNKMGTLRGSPHNEPNTPNRNQEHTPASARYLRPNTPLSKHHSASSSRSGTPLRKSPRIPVSIESSENGNFPPAPRRPSIQISITRHPSHDTLIYLKEEADDIPSEADDIPSDSEAIPPEPEADDIPSEEQTVTNSSSGSNSPLTTPNIRRASLRKTNTFSAQLHKLQQSALKELQSFPVPSSTAIAPQSRPQQAAPQIQHPFLKNRQDDIPTFFTKRRANPDIADWLSRATNTQKPNNLSAMMLHTRELKTLLKYISPAASGSGASTWGKACTIVLHGPAWSGKTFTAKFLFDKVKADTVAASLQSTQAREFLWISCATYESLGKSLRDIFLARGMDVSKIGAGSVEHMCSKFSSWFAAFNRDQIASNGAGGGYLLVLDGVNNVHVLEALLGKCEQRWAGHVFVTATLLEDRVMSFIKGNSGDVALVPIGPVSDADVKSLLVGRGAEGEWVHQLPRIFGGVATRPLLFKRHMVTHKMAGSKLFDIAERRRREALPESLTRTNFMKAMLDYSMESLIARHGWFGEACIAVLELMSVVSGPAFSLTLEATNAMLGLQPGDFVLKEIFKLIEARGLIVKLDEIASQQFTFCVPSEIHEMMLENRCMTMVSLKCVYDALTSLLQSSLADESDPALRTYAVQRYFYGCSNLLRYLEKQLICMHPMNQTEDQAPLDSIIRACTKLGLSLFKEKKFYQSVQCFKLVAGFSKLEVSLCKESKKRALLSKFLELVHDLIGCIATELVTATAAAAVGPNSAVLVQQTAQPTSKPLARRTSTISATGSTTMLSAAVQTTEPLKQPFSKRLQQQLLQKEKEATQRDTLKFAAPAVSSIDLMFAIMIQPGLDRPFEYAESALKESLQFIQEVYRCPEGMCTVQEARQQLHLAYLHAQWSFTLAQAYNSINASITGNSTSTQKSTDFQRHAASFKHYAVCAANTLTNVYGCDAHVDVIGILAICATAYIMEGDRMMAWNYVRRSLKALEQVFGVTIETAFEISAEPNHTKKKGGNGFTRAFEEVSVHWIVKEMLSLKFGLNLGEAMDGGQLYSGPLGIEDAKRLYRKLLLAAEELRDLQCGPIFQSFVCRYDIQDPEESTSSSERTEIVLEEVPSEASDIDESDLDESMLDRTPSEASDIPSD